MLEIRGKAIDQSDQTAYPDGRKQLDHRTNNVEGDHWFTVGRPARNAIDT